ncbi:hypothetical protein [Fictibacillus sp. NRS-1165]|uniref:hypothetical protein n=1 Tax=Fictibacillus sp. NRS-1165 TaxID=3144463 RepID=UPI003D22D4DF
MGKGKNVYFFELDGSEGYTEEARYQHSWVRFIMHKSLIERVNKEVEEVSGDAMGLDFSSFVNNALLVYLNSEEWEQTKQHFIDQNKEG